MMNNYKYEICHLRNSSKTERHTIANSYKEKPVEAVDLGSQEK